MRLEQAECTEHIVDRPIGQAVDETLQHVECLWRHALLDANATHELRDPRTIVVVILGRHALVAHEPASVFGLDLDDGAQYRHIRIGDGATVAAQAGVFGDVPAGATVSGYPARPHRESLRAQAGLSRLPDLMKRLRALERAVMGGESSKR